MNIVKVLVKGYAKVNSDGTWDATSTTTFIDNGKLKIIVDPGCNRKLLLLALKKNKLKTKDIDYIFLTHYHPDHCALAGVFENAKIFDGVQWQKDSIGGDLKGDVLPETDIQIIKTPGHTHNHSSLLVKTEEGKILIGADVFWWKDNENQTVDITNEDEFAEDMISLRESRIKALQIADFIIPGHGKMFKVDKQC